MIRFLLIGSAFFFCSVAFSNPTVTKLTYTIIPKTVTAYGTVVSPDSVTLRAQVSGTVSSVNFSAGQAVKKGQLLFTLQSNSNAIQLNALESALKFAKNKYERNVRFSKELQGAVSKIQLAQLKSEYQQAESQYQEARSIQQVVSPIAGIVSDTQLTVGSFVNLGKELVVISDLTDLQLKYQLPGNYAKQIALGQKVIFYPSNNSKKQYTGEVSYIAPALDPINYNISVRANFSTRSDLEANTFGRIIQIVDPGEKVLVIPQSLIKTDAKGFYVYVLDNKNKPEKKYCKLGKVLSSGMVEIQSGLTEGMQLITSDVK